VLADELDGIETCHHQALVVSLFDHCDCVLWIVDISFVIALWMEWKP
jgi:hypothetical protein